MLIDCTSMRRLLTLWAGCACCALPLLAAETEEGGAHGHAATFLFEMVIILIASKVGGELFVRMNQPEILGQFAFGVLLGNLSFVGATFMQGFVTDEALILAAEIGIILLVFEIGLEANINELMAIGSSALLAAVLGSVAPMILGFGVSMWFLPEAAWYVHTLVGATLAASSVTVTARVLTDMGKTDTKEARIIRGAAIVNIVFGLVILAVVSGIVGSIVTGGSARIPSGLVMLIIGKAVVFLAIAVVAGQALAGRVIGWGSRAKVAGIPVVLTISYCFLMAAIAETIGLAAIVGAFAAGLVLDETHYRGYHDLKAKKVEELLAPISAIYAPVFFVLIGLRLDLSALASASVQQFALVLSIAAIVGKQICSLGVWQRGLNRLAIGAGMIPRGEIGLIFAGIGTTLTVGGAPVFSPETFSAIVVMVIITTLLTPPLLKTLLSSR